MDVLDLARWQFGLTTLYHFLFVPLTLGLALAVAIFQTAWVRTGNLKWLHLTRFFGKIFLINFAMGVVTGIVQEFQFGMNWSSYSRFVGDVFGAPLAFEGLLAFFLEATFIGLWIFGWDKLPKGAPPRDASGSPRSATWFSAYFILAANAFMQNPVGYEVNPVTDRAEMNDFGRGAHQTRLSWPSSTRSPRPSWWPARWWQHLDLAAGQGPRCRRRASPRSRWA